MSIEFKCPGCGNKMEAKDNLAGKRGKCPECGRLITVPQHSSNEIIIASEEQGYFRSKRLNALFEDFLNEYSDDIQNCRFLDEIDTDGAILEISTDCGRTQLVAVFLAKEDGAEVLYGHSIIGRHPEYLNFDDILVDMALHLPPYPTYSVFIRKNNEGANEIGLQKATRLEHVDKQTFFNFTIRLARIADAVESKHYDNDAN